MYTESGRAGLELVPDAPSHRSLVEYEICIERRHQRSGHSCEYSHGLLILILRLQHIEEHLPRPHPVRLSSIGSVSLTQRADFAHRHR